MKINLIDGSFSHLNASNYGGDNIGVAPEWFEWYRVAQDDKLYPLRKFAFFTDIHLEKVKQLPKIKRKIAWLIEPPSISDTHYKAIVELEDYFDYILTFDESLLMRDEKYLYYPFGGSWIRYRDWGMWNKTKMVSLIGTQKQRAEGHKLRHRAADMFAPMGIDVMGRGYRPIESKIEGLRDYRYSIVIESCKLDTYFSEKLIDCLCQGTVPIYWGSANILDIFNPDGILTFNTMSELQVIIDNLSNWDYNVRRKAIEENIEKCKRYACAEDWIFEEYPWLFANE